MTSPDTVSGSPIRERRATFATVATRTLELDGAGPPFLLLHGYSDSADTWRPLLRELADRQRAAVAVDLPGFGTAAARTAGPMLPQLDRFVAAAVETLDGAPVIVGNSLGGTAGLRAACEPELPLGGVVAISPGGLGHQRWVDLIERDPIVQRLLTVPVPLPMPAVRWAVRLAYRRLAVGRAERCDRGAVTAYAAQYRQRSDVTRLIRDARSLLGELREPITLERIARPVLLLWGARDLLIPSRSASLVLDAVPDSELVLLDHAGHCPQLEEPDRVAEIICEFADRRSAASSMTTEGGSHANDHELA